MVTSITTYNQPSFYILIPFVPISQLQKFNSNTHNITFTKMWGNHALYLTPMPSTDTTIFSHKEQGFMPRCAMCLTCTCLDTTLITKQRVVDNHFHCRQCTVTTDTMDMDRVQDISLTRGVCCAMLPCCCDAGTIRVFGSDASQYQSTGKAYFDVSYIFFSSKVFERWSDFLTKGQYPGFRLGSRNPGYRGSPEVSEMER